MITNEIREAISACALPYEISALDWKWNKPVGGGVSGADVPHERDTILPHKHLHYVQDAVRLHPRIFFHEIVSVVE
jgi:hypothetical protein